MTQGANHVQQPSPRVEGYVLDIKTLVKLAKDSSDLNDFLVKLEEANHVQIPAPG